MISPIALFVYNRPYHTQQTIESLKKNTLAQESDLIIFSDGPKDITDPNSVLDVRTLIRQTEGFKSVQIIESSANLGLAQSIISGVTHVIDRFGKIIVLEDDLVTSPFFLKFMNEALDFYESEESVISIHGYTYPVKQALPETFFLRGADCWGWATWKRGWELFESNGEKLLKKLQELRLTGEFDFNGAFGFTRMLVDQIEHKNDSWAIRWNASAFLSNKLTLYPGKSLVHNIGNDLSGRHSGNLRYFDTEISANPIPLASIPTTENKLVRNLFGMYLQSIRLSFFEKIKHKLRSWNR